MNKDINMQLPSACDYDHVENFVIVPNLFTPKECNDIVSICKKQEKEKAATFNRKKGNEFSEYRECTVSFIEHSEEVDWIYSRISNKVIDMNDQFFKFSIWGFGEALQFLEYNSPTGCYKAHTDKLLRDKVRKLTFILMLTNDNEYDGGNLQVLLNEEPTDMPRQQGTMIMFPSYTLHRVTPITKGMRHTIACWVTGEPFK